jgi:DNA-binding NarL/FixJ family response regulator
MDGITRLLIAEDETLLAEGLQKLLECEFRVVEIAACGRDLLNVIEASQPDVIVLGAGMPALRAIQTARRQRKIPAGAKIVLLTDREEPAHVEEALRAGAAAYILKRCGTAELLKAIRQVLNGASYVTDLIPQPSAVSVRESGPQSAARQLTSRQREVLQLVADGYTAKEIANSLNLSVKTAVFHRMAIRDKLGLRTTAALTKYALENGISPYRKFQDDELTVFVAES